eukprot:CAMPEP_0177762732 /NCGR_PEP_ID=MMETSP0491_2-20121128/6500_1 /TAXON_ID=63592 /ORGANISM="Tetraselmis chuii, Strain PLY429" /LENGTH=429 /DNA_ID=CAMNT_0019278803 /DNA_START=312 /DNA_END=1601 /DNA_ORIENTATION=-
MAAEEQPFGELLAWGDPNWYRGYRSPFYGPAHAKWRDRARAFVEANFPASALKEWEAAKRLPRDLFRKTAAAGFLPCVVGEWPEEYAGRKPDGYDPFFELIFIDELARCGSGGVLWGLVEGLAIGLPPVLQFGSQQMASKVGPACLSGDKVICLCISEPYAGSDVAGIRCTAEKDPSGKFYVVNGEKKWITNGMFADYFTVAVRTGGKGMGGISLLLLEKGMPGIECKQMDCMGVLASGTAYITFDDVKVPVENLLGTENQGFKCIMHNFNHERWGFIVQANRFARVCLEDSMRYALKRKTFGKTLVEHPVIRWKLGEMARQVEATHAALENLTYQMSLMSHEEAGQLAPDICLLKVQATKVFEYCAREAAQIMGGVSYVRGGQGERVERLYREVRAMAIPGGSEEVMLDFAVRNSVKRMQELKSRSKL